MNWTLCIDFGTAFSKAAVAPRDAWERFDPAAIHPLMLNAASGNAFLLDSAVFVDDSAILFGREALARAAALADKKRTALRSFKTMLSASDLDRALNTNVPASIDPQRGFVMRDLIVLYLAFLTASIDRALGMDSALGSGEFALRYAAPAWRSGDGPGMHAAIVRLFGEAEAVRDRLGDALLDAHGVPTETARAALSQARGAQGPDMGMIFEATAAAAYSSIGLGQRLSNLIVVDMGAGTTDLAALVGVRGGVSELPDARVTMKQAGDFIDGIIANLAVESRRDIKTDARRADLWRAMMRDMRDFKESLFAEGRAITRFENRGVSLSLNDLTRDPDFKRFEEALNEAYAHSLAILCDYAADDGVREVQAIAVGGGAAAPFIQAMIARKPRGLGRTRVSARPATPDWAHDPVFRGNLAPVFPQLAIAIGGALAPEGMIAARGRATQGAPGRTGIPAGRD